MWQPSESATLNNNKVYSYIHKKNNLRVILCPVSGSSCTAYMRAVSAGSKEEAGTTPEGAAHFIEHMSFRIQNGKIWSLASKGDVINAETNMDSTRFFVVHLPNQTEETIKIDAARFKENAVPADKLSTEMKAVLNELERGEQIGNKMFHTTSSVAILEHPYHHSTIGTETTVQQTKPIDMEHFRSKYYVPNNTTLIFVGALNPPEIMKHVDMHFGGMLPGLECNPIHSPEPQQHGKRIVELCSPSPCPMICMAFRAPRGNTKESVAFQVISRLVYHRSKGRASGLIADGTFHDLSTYAPRNLDPYLWFFHGTYAQTSKEIRETNVEKMLEILHSFITHKVSSEQMNHAKNSLIDDWTRGTESVQDIMNEIGRSVSMANWEDFQDKHLQLECLTSEDIRQVAKTYFNEQNMTVTHVIPSNKGMIEKKTRAPETFSGQVSPELDQIETVGSEGQWTINRMTPVTHFIHTPRASYVRAIVSARFSPAEHDKATLLVATMNESVAREFTNTLSENHSEMTIGHNHEFIHMNMAFPCSVESIQLASSRMFNDNWLSPNLSEGTLSLHKKHLVAELESRKTDQNWLVKKHFIGALFERTQYDIPIDERVRRISELSTKDIKRFHNDYLKKNDSTYVTMITPSSETAAALGNILPAHSKIPTQTLEWTSATRKESTFTKKLNGYGSTAIMMGQTVSKDMTYKEKIALKAACEILGGGMTGRLMHTVREQKGLGTYGIYAVLQTISSKTDPIVCVQGTFSPSSLKEGLLLTKELIGEWHAQGVTPLELSNAKDRLIGSLTIATDEVDQLGAIMLKYIMQGKDPEREFQRFKETTTNLSLEDVNSALNKYVDPTKFAEVIVGPV